MNNQRYSWTTKLFILSCTIIPVVNWLIFYLGANLSSFGMAFTNKSGQISFDNFVRFFNEFSSSTSDIRIALRNTLLTFAIIVITFPLKVLVSYFLYKKVPGHKFFRIVFFLPSLMFSVATSMAIKRMLDANGFISQAVGDFMNLGYAPELLADSRFANIVVLLELQWMQFPGDMIIWGGTFARIPEEVLESAQIDGVTWWQEFTKITVPLVWPTVALKMILLTCGIFGSSGAVFLLTGGKYNTITLSVWMYLQLLKNSGGSYNSNVYNYMSAVGMIMTVIAVTISIFVRRYTNKKFDDVDF